MLASSLIVKPYTQQMENLKQNIARPHINHNIDHVTFTNILNSPTYWF
jgi:hypothetical protein